MTDRADLRIVENPGTPGLVFAGELSHADWRDIGLGLARERCDSAFEWRIGDWAVAASGVISTLAEAAGIVGESEGNIRKFVSVARVFQPVRRRTNVSFHLHLEVVALPEVEQERLLDLASAEHWTRALMREEARDVRRRTNVSDLAGENARLKRDLAAARADRDTARAALRATEARTKDAIGEIGRVWHEIDQVTAAFFDPDNPAGAAALHGNARAKAATRLKKRLEARVAEINTIAARIEARLVASGAADTGADTRGDR